jgi:hypothetical protein
MLAKKTRSYGLVIQKAVEATEQAQGACARVSAAADLLANFCPKIPENWKSNSHKEDNKIIVEELGKFRDYVKNKVRGNKPNGKRGRKCPYSKSVAYAVKVKRRKPETKWGEIWTQCKQQIDTKPTWKNEKLPRLEDIKTFARVVNRRLKEPAPSRDAT